MVYQFQVAISESCKLHLLITIHISDIAQSEKSISFLKLAIWNVYCASLKHENQNSSIELLAAKIILQTLAVKSLDKDQIKVVPGYRTKTCVHCLY